MCDCSRRSATSCRSSRVAGHTGSVPSDATTIEELLQPLRDDPKRSAVLLDVDGVLAPIVAQPDDAHMPETTRRPLIEVAKRYGDGRLRLRPPGLGRAPDRLARLDRLPRLARLARSCCRGRSPPCWTPSCRRGRAGCRPSPTTPTARSCGGCACAWRTRRRSPPCTGAASPDEEDALAAIEDVAEAAEEAGFVTHWGRKVLEIRPPVRIDKGAGIVGLLGETDLAAAVYVGDDITDLDAFRGLSELQERGRLGYALRVGVRSDETPSALEERPTRSSTGPRACADCCAPCCFEVRGLPEGHGAAERGLGDAARGADGGRAAELLQRHRRLRLLRLVDPRDGHRLGNPQWR